MAKENTKREIKKYEELTFSDDFMFGKVLYNNIDICKELLELILNKKICELRYSELQKNVNITYEGKSVRFDVYTENDDTAYDIEMQVTKKEDLPKRCRYYHGMMDLNLIEKGELYSKLKCTYVIFICNYNLGKDMTNAVFSYQNRCDQEPDRVLGDDSHTILINTYGNCNNNTKMAALLKYIRTGIVEESENNFVARIHEMVCKARSHEEWRLEYMTLQMRDQENIARGDAIRLVSSVESIMENLNLTTEEACKALNVTLDDYNNAKVFIEN